MYHGWEGFVHFYSGIAALLTGSLVLMMKKGTSRHRFVGYLYVISMSLLLITSFMIYRLWGGWGIFHYLAVVSVLTLLAGFIPIVLRKPENNFIEWHFGYMYWSVMGLYAAFMAEMMVRIPPLLLLFEGGRPGTLFFIISGLAIFLVMGLGGYYFGKNKPHWEQYQQWFS